MIDPNPTPTPSAAVDALVKRFVTQLEESSTHANEHQDQLKTLRKQTKDPELRHAADAAIKEQAELAAEAAGLAKQIHLAANPMLVDLELLIEVATRGL